jgi:serine phosphatase RsbU (regulator of sigma subunit)
MIDVIRRMGSGPAQDTIDALVRDCEEFRGDCVMRDDMSLLVIRRTP